MPDDSIGISLSSKNIMHEYFTLAVVALYVDDLVSLRTNYNALKGYLDREQFAAYLGEYAEPLVTILDEMVLEAQVSF